MTNKIQADIFRRLPSDKSTIIYIPYSPARGKTTLKNTLRKMGYTVVEEHEVFKLGSTQEEIDILMQKIKQLPKVSV